MTTVFWLNYPFNALSQKFLLRQSPLFNQRPHFQEKLLCSRGHRVINEYLNGIRYGVLNCSIMADDDVLREIFGAGDLSPHQYSVIFCMCLCSPLPPPHTASQWLRVEQHAEDCRILSGTASCERMRFVAGLLSTSLTFSIAWLREREEVEQMLHSAACLHAFRVYHCKVTGNTIIFLQRVCDQDLFFFVFISFWRKVLPVPVRSCLSLLFNKPTHTQHTPQEVEGQLYEVVSAPSSFPGVD